MRQKTCRRWALTLTYASILHFSRVHGRLSFSNKDKADIARQQMVFFADDTDAASVEQLAAEAANATGSKVLWVYRHVKGVALTGGSQSKLERLLSRVGVASIEQDALFGLDPDDIETYGKDFALEQVQPSNTMDFVPNGLDRIDRVQLPLDGRYAHRRDGAGVSVYILDSGLRTTHVEFKNRRVFCGFDAFEIQAVTNRTDPTQQRCFDAIGHGTHVAGTVGGRISGVAKNASLISVRVLDSNGYGSLASILAGLDYVMGQKKAKPNTPMVVNMSLGGIFSRRLNAVVAQLVDAGVVLVSAAGNRGLNGCLSSPGSAKAAINVGASTFSSLFRRDRRARFSNHGRCVDIFAPGTQIISASAVNDTAFRVLSGTSMAAPHVAGAVALYLQTNKSLTPAQVRTALLEDATQGQLMWLFNRWTPNKLLFTGGI